MMIVWVRSGDHNDRFVVVMSWTTRTMTWTLWAPGPQACTCRSAFGSLTPAPRDGPGLRGLYAVMTMSWPRILVVEQSTARWPRCCSRYLQRARGT